MAMFARSIDRRTARWWRQGTAALALAAVNLALCAAVALELYAPAESVDAAPGAVVPRLNAARASNEFSLPPLATLSAVTERPLFAHNRRPLPPPAAPVQAADLSSYALAGITVAGAQRTALVRHGMPPVITPLTEGQEIDGWTVRQIGDDRIVLREAGTDAMLFLYRDAAASNKR